MKNARPNWRGRRGCLLPCNFWRHCRSSVARAPSLFDWLGYGKHGACRNGLSCRRVSCRQIRLPHACRKMSVQRSSWETESSQHNIGLVQKCRTSPRALLVFQRAFFVFWLSQEPFLRILCFSHINFIFFNQNK